MNIPLSYINFHIWWKVCKPVRSKYRLSTNCLLVLNASYILSRYNNGFTRRRLRDFAAYYSDPKIESYITTLLTRNCLILAESTNKYQYYNISEYGIKIIEELNKSYENQLYLFCNKYNIEL